MIGLNLIRLDQSESRYTVQANDGRRTLLPEDERCGEYDQVQGKVDPLKQVCYSNLGKAAACHGDTGGPIVYKRNGKVKCLIEISSYNYNLCTNSKHPSIFTRVATFEKWIERRLTKYIINKFDRQRKKRDDLIFKRRIG